MDFKKLLYKDYEELVIKNDKLENEYRRLKYEYNLLVSQNKNLRKEELELKELAKQRDNKIKELEFEVDRLKALLNIDGTNHGIPTSQTPINKKKVIPNTREKSNLPKGGQKGHKKNKLEKFK